MVLSYGPLHPCAGDIANEIDCRLRTFSDFCDYSTVSKDDGSLADLFNLGEVLTHKEYGQPTFGGRPNELVDPLPLPWAERRSGLIQKEDASGP